MREAVRKLSLIDGMLRSLPGRDCGTCGSPSCAAFAEDVVLGRLSEDACRFAGKTGR
jgi:Na+-translocating ferredoxin:NAD+ oxidoreductase RNF subunit RnfB